jgi:hypothetical protein
MTRITIPREFESMFTAHAPGSIMSRVVKDYLKDQRREIIKFLLDYKWI